MASISKLARFYLALILHHNEVTITKDRINALINEAGVNVDLSVLAFCKTLANIDIRRLTCKIGADGPAPSIPAAPIKEKRMDAKKESKESDDDLGFDLFD